MHTFIHVSWGARHFSYHWCYNSEQNKNPCSHRAYFLARSYLNFPKISTFRGWILGIFNQELSCLGSVILACKDKNLHLILYSSHAINLGPFWEKRTRKWTLNLSDQNGISLRHEEAELGHHVRRRELPALGKKWSTHGVLHLSGQPAPYLQCTDQENKKWDQRSFPRQAASVWIKFAEQCTQLHCLQLLIHKVRWQEYSSELAWDRRGMLHGKQ